MPFFSNIMKSPKTNNCNDVADRKRSKMVNTMWVCIDVIPTLRVTIKFSLLFFSSKHWNLFIWHYRALLLLSKKKIVSKEWLKRLPKMSKAIEIMLFRRSPSLEDYLNTSSLKDRIKIIAEDVASMHLRRTHFKKLHDKPSSWNHKQNFFQ